MDILKFNDGTNYLALKNMMLFTIKISYKSKKQYHRRLLSVLREIKVDSYDFFTIEKRYSLN